MAVSRQIQFNYLAPFSFTHRTELKSFILGLFKEEGTTVAALNFIFCDDAYLLSINQQYLNHDTLTDIITFPYAQSPEPIRSDIFISIERVRENAELFRTTFDNELHRVIFHGCLHLCGYKDKSRQAQQVMRSKEDYYLKKYLVSRGTAKG